MTETFRSAETRLNRRTAMGALVAGAGALVFGPAGTGTAEDDTAGGSSVSWDDGWEYPIVGSDESGQWVVAFDEGEHLGSIRRAGSTTTVSGMRFPRSATTGSGTSATMATNI